jgi:hypothetical protein
VSCLLRRAGPRLAAIVLMAFATAVLLTVGFAGRDGVVSGAAPLGPIDNGPVVPGDDITVPYEDPADTDFDGDADNDWLPDADEAASGTDPLVRDTDDDLVLDGAETVLGSDPLRKESRPACALAADGDLDCLPAAVEVVIGTSDYVRDTDRDGISDGAEFMGWGTSPTRRDSDGDGCDDDKEIVDVNGDAVANVLDYARVAQRAFRIQDDDPNDGNPVPDFEMDVSAAFDLNKDGAVTVIDVTLAALNSSLVEPAADCGCRRHPSVDRNGYSGLRWTGNALPRGGSHADSEGPNGCV